MSISFSLRVVVNTTTWSPLR